MQRDQKIGASLGVLLLGVVGAFFFRDDAADSDPPDLRSAEAIDREIADDPHGPYLVDETASDNAAAQTVSRERPRRSLPTWELPDFLNGLDGAVGGPPAGAPDPIVGTGQVGEQNEQPAPIPLPPHNRAWTPEPQTSPPQTEGEQHGDGPIAGVLPDRYVVQPGETLSGLAMRFLGTATRYRELYELNRDVMDSPDDLQAGMTIRLPTPAEPKQERLEAAPASARSKEPGTSAHPSAAGPNNPHDQATTRVQPISIEAALADGKSPSNDGAQSNGDANESSDRIDNPQTETQAASAKGMFRPVSRSPLVPRGAATPAEPKGATEDSLERQEPAKLDDEQTLESGD